MSDIILRKCDTLKITMIVTRWRIVNSVTKLSTTALGNTQIDDSEKFIIKLWTWVPEVGVKSRDWNQSHSNCGCNYLPLPDLIPAPGIHVFNLVVYSIIAYRKTSNISDTLVGNKIVDQSYVVGALPVGTAPTTSSLST